MFRCAPTLPAPVIYRAQIGVRNYFLETAFLIVRRAGTLKNALKICEARKRLR